MKKVKITVMRMASYTDLMEQYENPILHACDMQLGQTFIVENCEKPASMCSSAWETMLPFITEEELLPSDITEITKRIIAFEEQISRMKELEKTIKSEKDRLKTAMEKAGVKKWETPSGYKITLIPDAEDKAVKESFFNAERFMADHPELVDQYMETKTVIKKGKKGYHKVVGK